MAERIKNMAEEAGQSSDTATTIPQAENLGVKSPIPGISPGLFQTLNQRHSPEFIQEQRLKYPTHEAFLEDAEKEAEHIRLTLAQKDKPKVEQVMANAVLPDEERLQAAEKLLDPLSDEQKRLQGAQKLLGGEPFTTEQGELTEKGQAILEAHKVGEGKPSETGSPASIDNYTREQIAQKARILKEAGFSKEQRRTLMEAGITGFVSPARSAVIDTAATDPAVRRIAEEMVESITAGVVDEVSLNGEIERIRRLTDNGTIANQAEGRNLKITFEALRKEAITGRKVERPAGLLLSRFENITNAINQLEQQPSSLGRDAALEDAIREKDLLIEQANSLELRLFDPSKAELSGLHYASRVKVTNSEKEGRDEYQGRGKLQELQVGRQQYSTWETNTEVWNSLRIREIEQNLGLNQGDLERTYGGIIDYFNQTSLDIIYEVVKDRKKYTSPSDPYPDRVRKIIDVWDGPVFDSAGRILEQEGNEVIAQNFDGVRAAIEEARRWEPWVPNRVDYETYIRFVADDIEELEEMIPYIVARVRRKLGTGQPDTLSNRLQSEKEKIDSALAAFPTELIPSEAQFRRLKSTLAANLDLMGTYYFSEKIRLDWQPYLGYTNLLAESCEDTDNQDHLIDSLFLDRDGLTMLALREFCKEDGIFWRYGQKSADLPTKARDINKFRRWQIRTRREITQSLLSNRLKRMGVLLGLEPDRSGNLTVHPAFQRIKNLYDALDVVDKTNNNGDILDVDNNPTSETRWQEYCRKALEWQNEGRFSDPREAERVVFQHPLARAFKPPAKNAQNQIEDEFLDMFEEDNQGRTDAWYRATKERKITSTLEKAERIARAFMVDSASVLAWHVFRTPEEVTEINEYLQAAGMDPITSGEAISQKTLYRVLMHSLIREDKARLPKDRMFMFYDLLTERLGIDLDVPTFSAWYLGWHDTNRPAVILKAIEEDTRVGGLREALNASRALGIDDKNFGASRAERERRLGILVLMVLKGKFGKSGKYFNFPGHDTKGAGNKDIRNWLNLQFGTSRDTVWLNDLLTAAIPTVREWPAEYGCTRDPFVQLVGLYKGGNEAIFAQSDHMGLIENPRDTVSWVKRVGTSVEQSKTITSGDKEGYALLKDGPFTSMYLWRDFDLANLKEKYVSEHLDPFFAVNNSVEAIKDMKESTYKAGIDLAKATAGPLIKVMKQTVESTVSANPGSARIVNTLIWYMVSRWMDTSWEYRQKPGYAVDGNLHLARYFIHTALLEYGENGLIYNDRESDEIMLGYVRRPNGTRIIRYEVEIRNGQEMTKDENGNWVTGEVEKGLVDAFPKKLRDEILNGTEMEIRDSQGSVVHIIKDYLLPFGLNSQYPETFANYYRDSAAVSKDYKGALNQIKPRKAVRRP